MIFAPVIAGFWVYLGKIRKEPSAIAKMGLGTLILGAGFILMVFAALERESSISGKSSMMWLCSAYFLHTIGELALSPVSLSFITNTVPKRMTSQVMGWYFAVTGVGGWLAAKIGIFAESAGETTIFGSIAIFTMVFGLLLMILAPAINKIALEKDGAEVCR
jgi:POT family proton-dependent oligopeptide transporter